MNFLEKNALYIKHQNPDALKADRKLLEEKSANHKVLLAKHFDKKKEANEILNALLDIASEEEIVKNRQGIKIPDMSKVTAGVPVKKKSKHQSRKH